MIVKRAILHDECLYHDPERFYPERFEEKMTPELEKLRDPFNYAFGFGRRYASFFRLRATSHYFVRSGIAQVCGLPGSLCGTLWRGLSHASTFPPSPTVTESPSCPSLLLTAERSGQ